MDAHNEDPLSGEKILSALRTSILGSRVDFFPITTSTMDDARQAAMGGAPEGARRNAGSTARSRIFA